MINKLLVIILVIIAAYDAYTGNGQDFIIAIVSIILIWVGEILDNTRKIKSYFKNKKGADE